MKKIFFSIFVLLTITASSQQALFIPDTLSGTSIDLTMHKDSVQFFPGEISHTLAFNENKFLGPTLILNKGDNVSITVDNQIEDTTTVHWHGLHVPSAFDGGPHTPIFPSEVWNPMFTVMDHAATYWYHPHMHMKTADQAIKGAAGLIIVRDDEEALLDLPRTYGVDDFPIIVQCQEYSQSNQVLPLGMQDSIVMVNGTRANYGESVYLDVPAQVVRLRMLNASGERAFNFGFTNNMSFYQIASDGGLLDEPYQTTRVRLAPGERAEILLDLSTMNGQNFYLMCYGSEMPYGVQGGPTMPMPPGSPPMDSPLNGVDYDILQLNVVASTVNPVTVVPGALVQNNPYLEASADAHREIRFTADNPDVMDGPFYFNGNSFDMMRIDYNIPLNNVEVWTLINETMVAHPFHIHDVQFFVLDRNSIASTPDEAGRKDVVFVLPGDTVRFITKFEDFVDTIPYMYHCHILMHEDDGMMGQFRVVPEDWVNGKAEEVSAINNFRVVPNPSHGQVRFEFGDGRKANVFVYNSLGKKILDASSVDGNIDISSLSSGVYFAKAFYQEGGSDKAVFIVE